MICSGVLSFIFIKYAEGCMDSMFGGLKPQCDFHATHQRYIF